TLRVREYTKKDGTHVRAHERRLPATKTTTTTSPSPTIAGTSSTAISGVGSAPIRIYIDPVTGVKTFTNEPEPVLSSRTITPHATWAMPRSGLSQNSMSSTVTSPGSTTPRTSTDGIARTGNGRIARSAAATAEFMRAS